MWQKQVIFDSVSHALSGLSALRAVVDGHAHADALLHVFTNGISRVQAQALVDALDVALPQVQRVGMSEYNVKEDAPQSLIKLNLILSKSARFEVVQLPVTPGGELAAGQEFARHVRAAHDVRFVELFTANLALNVSDFLAQATKGLEDVPIFGAIAKPTENVCAAQEDSFILGQGLLSSGFTLLLMHGDDLVVHMDYLLGWRPIGREMEFTADKDGDRRCVLRIDGQPAVDVYRKYLGVEWNEHFLHNVWEFPLMVRRNGADICLIPNHSDQGSLCFSGNIYAGEKLRFSYSTHDDILAASFAGSERMREFHPEAVLMSMCGNRIGFLGGDAHLEWECFQEGHRELVYCHGFAEIGCHKGNGGVLNSSIVAVGLREGGPCATATACFSQERNALPLQVRSGAVPLSHLVSHFFQQMTDELIHLQHNLESEVERKTRENKRLSLHVVQTLAEAIDAKDTYTNGHSGRVASYAREIATRAGFEKQRQDEIYMIGLLHDVGKIGVPDSVINKPARLSDEEYEIIKGHPVMGARILSKIKEMPKLVTGARWHHERFDGRGYPDSLVGTDIPEEARIIAVADAYDAMTSNRSYRDARPQAWVRAEMVRGRGSQFDPRFADIMLAMIDEDTDYMMRER